MKNESMETKHLGNFELRIFNNLEEISKEAVSIFVLECKKTLEVKKIFTVSLCGGSTPKRLFELLADEFKQEIFWQTVHIFWGDERADKDNPKSNFQTASKIWLEKIIDEIPNFENNIHRIKMELGLNRAVQEYEKELDKFAPEGFNLSFNGIGADGHRNGIFPENPEVNWKNGIWDLPESAKVFGYELPSEINHYTERITLTPWFLNKSKVNILMLSGEEKTDVLRKITIDKENYTRRELPAITFNDVPTIVLSDKKAASKII